MTDSMTTKFFIEGNTVSVITLNEDTTVDKLKPMVYSVGYNQIQGFFLNILKDRMETPTKVYGKTSNRVNKVIKTYDERPTSTGILLTGIKGAGKTMMSSLLCNEMIDKGVPIIIINTAFDGDAFVNFIDSIGECVIFFDEFGKIYKGGNRNEEQGAKQDGLLTLMDGVSKQKRLVILTENDVKLINDFMMNRPGRVYYHFKYDKLDEESIEEYAKSKNFGDTRTEELLEISRKMPGFSFDVLQTIVEECLRYNTDEALEDIIEDLNINFEAKLPLRAEVKKLVEKATNKEVPFKLTSMFVDIGMGQYDSFYIDIKANNDSNVGTDPSIPTAEDDEDGSYTHFNGKSDLRYERGDVMVFENSKYSVVVEKVTQSFTNFRSF